MKDMPPPDYSYVVQPEYNETQEILESKTKLLFNAEEVKIGASGFHKYDPKTKKQSGQIYRLQTVLLNSRSIVDFRNEAKMNDLGREVARFVLSNISNINQYYKIEISFINKEDNDQVVYRQNIFYRIPNLEITQMLDK